jgi:hypothetical protein
MTSGDVFDTLTDREAGGLQYLEEKFPEKRPLLPKDLLQRAHIYQVVFLMSANIQPLQNSQILVGGWSFEPFLITVTSLLDATDCLSESLSNSVFVHCHCNLR